MPNAIRDLSARLFKARYRLEVGAAIAQHAARDSQFCNKDLVQTLGDPPGKGGVSNELKTLRASGLVMSDGTADSGRHQYLRATQSSYWEMCRELSDSAERYLSTTDS